ncbi:hypothetical protein ERO13_1Z049623v2 [Gossypium hirsutum]|nr:hypothetical protein ERO13_1Z049623v2 [Gossypium hirsutum]
MKVKVVCRKLYDYVRYDLKEIAFPSSLPDPPHIKKRRKLTWHERFLVLKEASRLYAASWVRDIGPDLRPNDYKKDDGQKVNPMEIRVGVQRQNLRPWRILRLLQEEGWRL